jgi:hypothetical protein
MKSETKACFRNLFTRLCLPTVVAYVVWLFVHASYVLKSPLSVFLNIEGTFLLAFAISFPQGPKALKWWLCEATSYGSTPSFSYLNFYLGLVALIAGITVGAIQ